MRHSLRLFFVLIVSTCSAVTWAASTSPASDSPPPRTEPVQHPALFLVGDSIMNTGTGNGEKGPWGWGAEIGVFFQPGKIHVYNEGRGGRSSRGYIEEGAWGKVLDQMQAGDFVIIQFAHNDAANSANYPDRTTINSGGDETVRVGVGDQSKVIKTYGAYLRQYVADAKAKGVQIIICSPVPRNIWADGKIKRGFDGYVGWAADAAKSTGTPYIDLNKLVSDRFDALGQEKTRELYNDQQHTKKSGARINAECVVAGIRSLKDSPLKQFLVAPSP